MKAHPIELALETKLVAEADIEVIVKQESAKESL